MKLVSAIALFSVLAIGSVAAQPAPAPLPAPREMSRSALQAEVAASRPLVQNGAVTPMRPSGCVSTENRQFDFWAGEWDVTPTGQTFVLGESTISVVAQGCVIMEYWRPFQGAEGRSINIFDPTDRLWHQEYADATGLRTPFRGSFQDGVMRLDNLGPVPAGAPAGLQRRMNFQRIDADTVRQWGEVLRDDAWVVTWDLTYHRRSGSNVTR